MSNQALLLIMYKFNYYGSLLCPNPKICLPPLGWLTVSYLRLMTWISLAFITEEYNKVIDRQNYICLFWEMTFCPQICLNKAIKSSYDGSCRNWWTSVPCLRQHSCSFGNWLVTLFAQTCMFDWRVVEDLVAQNFTWCGGVVCMWVTTTHKGIAFMPPPQTRGETTNQLVRMCGCQYGRDFKK